MYANYSAGHYILLFIISLIFILIDFRSAFCLERKLSNLLKQLKIRTEDLHKI